MKPFDERAKDIAEKCLEMRRLSCKISVGAEDGSHIGPALSQTEIVATLYFESMKHDPKNPRWEDRDRFVLSKGHAVLTYYAALALAGYFPVEELYTFERFDSKLSGHPIMNMDMGIEVSTGSLGQGLAIGAGMAIAAKVKKQDHRVFVLLGDGECQEGEVWEAALSSAHHNLNNLVAIVDYNRLQCDEECRNVCDMGDMRAKFEAFGWETIEVDGHDIPALMRAFAKHRQPVTKPLAVICNTIKGKGVSIFENAVAYHHTGMSQELCDAALADLQ